MPVHKIIMFTDQVSSTANMAARIHAEILQVNHDQSALTAHAVARCGGTILKDTGDGAMIEFPSCSHAVLCGHLIQRDISTRNGSQPRPQLRFDLHIGIDMGEAVVLSNEDLRANAANLAARVCAQCPAGDVYFTEKVKQELHAREASVAEVGRIPLKGVEGEVTLYRLDEWLGQIEPAHNPFVWRDGITLADAFFIRDRETRTLRDYVHGGQNCQIVGARRIGKTSLLRQVERKAREWKQSAVVVYLDLQDARCFTLGGWLRQVGQRFGLHPVPTSLAEFAEGTEALLKKEQHPILCLDEFEQLTSRPAEFTSDLFLTLRSAGQQGMSIVTASQRPLSELTHSGDPSSPFYNTFSILPVKAFNDEEASDFVTIHRPGIAPFSSDQKQEILRFAGGHPLALQVAAFHVLNGFRTGVSVAAALAQARDEMKACLRDW